MFLHQIIPSFFFFQNIRNEGKLFNAIFFLVESFSKNRKICQYMAIFGRKSKDLK